MAKRLSKIKKQIPGHKFTKTHNYRYSKKGKRKVQEVPELQKMVRGVPQSQNAAFPRPQEEEKTDKSKQAQIEQTYEKHLD